MSVSTVSHNTAGNGLQAVAAMATNGYLSATLTLIFYRTLVVFQYAREAWKLYGRVKPLIQPNGFFKTTVGLIVDNTVGKNQAVRIAAYLLLINNRFNEARRAANGVYRTWTSLKCALWNECPVPKENCWQTKTILFFSPSTSLWIREKSQAMQNRSKRIVILVMELAKDTFRLIMYVLDVKDACCLNPLDPASDVRVYEIFSNGVDAFEQLERDQESLLDLIHEHRHSIKAFLAVGKEKGVPLPEFDSIVSGLQATKSVTEKLVGAFGTTVRIAAILFSPFKSAAD